VKDAVAAEPPKPKVADVPRPANGTVPMEHADARDLQKDWAKYLDQPVIVEDKYGGKYALIPPGGPFLMDHKTGYTATVTRPYYLGVTEVTCADFKRFREGKPDHNLSSDFNDKGGFYVMSEIANGIRSQQSRDYNWLNPGYPYGDDLPVTQVTHHDAHRYCTWLSEQTGQRYRLPSEAEWKWACRGGTDTGWYSGHTFPTMEPFEWTGDNTNQRPQPVGKKRPNPWGLFDMMGNVMELTHDLYTKERDQKKGHFVDPKNIAEGAMFVVCGGSYTSTDSSRFPRTGVTQISATSYLTGYSRIGFRVLMEVDEPFR
jgi:formylglycine-generating enzyme required for sulfatase activity